MVCTRNSTPYGVKNGQLGTLEALDARRTGALLQVRLDEGGRVVTLPTARYAHLDHGYALTTHKAQGATVDHTFILAGGDMANRELGLVQLSRHRESARIFVDRSFYEQNRLDHGRPVRREPDPQARTSPQNAPTEPVVLEPTVPRDHAKLSGLSAVSGSERSEAPLER